VANLALAVFENARRWPAMRTAGLYAIRGDHVRNLCIARGAVWSRVRGAETKLWRSIKGDATRDAMLTTHTETHALEELRFWNEGEQQFLVTK
jgi:hypothetical protein